MTPIIVDLKQGSPDWVAWRSASLGSSDAAAILGLSPWTTPFQLWELKTGRREPDPANEAMRRGTELEVYARREFEFEHDADFQPACLIHPEHPFLKASLDGWSRDRTTVLEIKVPGQKAHATALAGKVPEYYVPQLDHLLLVSGAQQVQYWSYDPGQGGVPVAHERDESRIADLLRAEIVFWGYVERDEPPPATEADVFQRDDELWSEAAATYVQAEQELKRCQDYHDLARARLVELAGGQRSAGCGVKVTPATRQGAIDYKRAGKELEDILGEKFDFERFRRPPIEVTTVTVERGL